VANQEISAQKDLISQKNEDITASINYAFRIQSALLPFQSAINTAFKENFILFKPRDIVSGDFYWYENLKTKPHLHFIAAADCTGHGVPGAFMSMLGISGLNEALYQKHAESPELILNHLHLFIRNSLKQSETQNRDGMDIALCCYDEKNKVMLYAGAMNPLYYTKQNSETGLFELNEIKADKYPIGGVQAEEQRNFTLHSIQVEKPCSFYMFSDGFQDQFGGPKGKKFMVSNFKKLILENCNEPLHAQQNKLEKTLNSWIEEGKEHQIDDILVMGIKINP
jgi:serine phosphatase RsbU (regulator of sigma subunit)